MAEALYMGIDVAKKSLDVAEGQAGDHRQVKNTPQGIQALVTRMGTRKPALVVLESTGGYEQRCANALYRAGIKMAVVNPGRVREYARSIGQIAKTDKLDARLLASFAERVNPTPSRLPDEDELYLMSLIRRRRQLLDNRKAEINRRDSTHPDLQAQLEEHIQWLTNKIEDLDQEIEAFIAQHPLWS